ncbi:amidohydrolase [Spongiibacter sp. KMU-158]|uniref:Omega-amidase YafV n=1 Tax=Spongiibacter pelagi TaxID=2760804 RepID=A0A927GVL8_9GAMM|nr:amidohydrolase [Spongiibacter pelagi]MBD2858017.1 amidohydrolase [Spongiibacter pelagi]
MTDIIVCALQSPLDGDSPEQNRAQFAQQIAEAGSADVFVLPEMFATGFALSGKSIAEPESGPSLQWMQAMAKQHNAAITGSLAIQIGEDCFNRMYWVTPDGIEYYDKRHLFRMAGEHKRYAAGDKRKIITWRGLRFLLQVCYDLRFPVFSRNFQTDPCGDYDVILYVACWPDLRRRAWQQLLPARAIENQAYVIGVNRSGEDSRGNTFTGDSAIHDFLGEPLALAETEPRKTLRAALSPRALEKFREQFPVGLDADHFEIH